MTKTTVTWIGWDEQPGESWKKTCHGNIFCFVVLHTEGAALRTAWHSGSPCEILGLSLVCVCGGGKLEYTLPALNQRATLNLCNSGSCFLASEKIFTEGEVELKVVSAPFQIPSAMQM